MKKQIISFSFYHLKCLFFFNTVFGFFFFFNETRLFILKVGFSLCLHSFFFKTPFGFFFSFSKKTLRSFTVLKNTLFTAFFHVFLLSKKRLRFSGLGYAVEALSLLEKNIQINIGSNKLQTLTIPENVYFFDINRKKKKLRLRGFLLSRMNLFASRLRLLKPCDVYKRKGIRFRFEVITTKEGKKTGKR